MIEIIVHLIASFGFTTTENINVITCFGTGGDNSHQTCLVGTTFGFTEVNFTISNRIEFSFLWCRCRKTRVHTESMIALHDRITGNTIYTYRVVAGELGIIFGIIKAAIRRHANACIGAKYITFSIKFHWNTISVHVVSFTTIHGYHQTVTGIHTVALYQPRNIRSIKKRRNIILDLTGLYLRIQYQRLIIKERVNRYTGRILLYFTGFRIDTFQQSSEIIFLLFLAIDLSILYHPYNRIRTQITGVGIAKTTNHPVRE